ASLPFFTQSWQEAVDLRSVVYRHLSEYVPSIRCVVSVAKCPEEEQGHQMLLRTMEWFLFGEAPEDGFAKLQENKSSSQLCGRVFKGGETTYSCRDCAIDPTCVLCMDCFQSSVHRNHRYKMNCSYGGGLCDCGDVEAWKTGPFCTKHEPGLSEDINHASQIPAGVAERAQHLFDIIFRYLVDMLIWTENKGLPLELQFIFLSREKTDSYFCMLFNDEDHSVDHVIHSLQKSLGCSTKEAENYTWMVDKEGRRVIKHGTLQSCQETKQENNTNSVFQSPLRVEILHSTIVSHQTFACRLLSWLNHMIGYSAGLRQIFCDLALQQVPASDQPCFISRLMLSDVKLWKGARKAFHELIVCSLLMEAEYKRLFAIEFIKHYKQLQLESVEDDQDRNISVTALSVQIFTVPTLARHLIEEHDALKIITETIIELWSEHMENGKLNFQTQSQHKYFRNEVVLNDLKYVLISKPPLWTDRRRDRFLEGFNIFLRLLKSIQGMEPVCRQFGQHVEIEPDWEPAFTVQMFLKFILLMMQEWCASDEQVLLRAYKECHSVLSQCSNELIHCNTKKQSATLNLCGHSVSCVVSREPISIHLPLSRLLAGLHAHLSRSGAIDKLEQYVSLNSSYMLLRNGFSLVNQVFCYRSAKWREEMFDKDIVMLQIGASLMDPNHFLMLVLNKFELFEDFTKHSIPKSKVSDEIKQNVSLLEEFLHLIIMVVGERHVPGIGRVTKEEVTMREVIHLLSIESMAHSSLVKALPENESNETGLEKVIHEVATFKKPGLSGHGVYELKPECLKEFNLYFYHYDKSQQTKAEDEQKKRKKQANSNEALPPPVPPQFVPAFAKITSILNCDVFMLILRTVCQQAVSSKGQLWSEAMIQKVRMYFFVISFQGIGSSAVNAQSVLSLVEHLKRVPQLNAHKDMILWTLQMFDAVKKLREKSSPFSAARAEIQRTDEAVQDKDKAERKRKAEAAKLHRQKIMAQMSAMQKNFIESNKHLYEKATEVLGHGAGATEEDSSTTAVEDSGVALGPKQGAVAAEKIILTCILCQEEQEVRVDGMAMVLTACVQRSTALTQNTCQVVRNTGENCDPLFMHPDLGCGTHAGSCGHVMHASCWQKYFEAVQNSTRHRLHADLSFHLDNVEYLCPLCKSLCNAVIPVLPLQAHSLNRYAQLLTLPKWLENVLARITGLNISHTQGSNQMQENPASWKNPVEFRSILSFGVQPPLKFSDSIVKMLMLFAMAVHREGLKVSTNEADVRVPVMVWGACAFTIQSIGTQQPLVSSVLAFPSLYWEETVELQPSDISSTFNNLYLFHLITMAHIVQILFTSTSDFPMEQDGEESEEAQSAVKLYEKLRKYTSVINKPHGWYLWNCVKCGITPFLRSSALFFNYLLGVPPSKDLWKDALEGQFEALCYYFALPSNLFKLFEEYEDTMSPLLQRWCSDSSVLCQMQGFLFSERFPRERKQLMELPEDYSCLLNQDSRYRCPHSTDDETRNAVLCMFCGTMICSQSQCCQQQVDGKKLGGCSAHAVKCGSGLGIFLRIKECQVLLLAGKNRGCFVPAPYLDDYGETDQLLKRGNPLHLCPDRYRKLQQMWRQHRILEEIARNQDANHMAFAVDWHEF
uniref:E3 ubiquitin-protein ligase n=1 Tax=Callorhinchus milii TaxID=7868 RepID=A0A4W3KE80_CALMI